MFSRKVYWIPKAKGLPDSWKSNVKMEIIEKIKLNSTSWQVKLSFAGPTQISFVLSPGLDYKLTNWSITNELPQPGLQWKGRETYFVFHERGVENLPFEVTCNFQKIDEVNLEPNQLLDVHFSSFFLYGSQMLSPDLTEFSNKFPSWAYTYSWSTIVQFYSITV